MSEERYRSGVEEAHALRRHPRTAAGATEDGLGVLVTVDGRAEEAAGLSLRDLARLLAALGVRDAVNLDGGGSTTMWTEARGVVNHPSDDDTFGPEGARPVRSAIIVADTAR